MDPTLDEFALSYVTIKNSKILFKSESIHDDPHHQRYQIMQQLAKSMK
jgi:hypothetical protein